MNKKYIKGIILLGLTASIGFSSCQVVNKYKTPEVDSEELFRDENPTDTTSIADLSWREYFKDPILQALIEEGLEQNFDMQIAMTRIQQAEASLSMARAAYFPNVALVGQFNQSRTSINDAGVKDVLGYSSTQYGLGIAVTWEADLWGKLNRQARASFAQMLSTHAYRDLIQTSLISNIATSYYSLMALDEQLRVTKETVELLRQSSETMQALKDAGMLNGAAVEQSKGLMYGTAVSIPSLEIQIRTLENSLCLLLARKPGSVMRASIENQDVPEELSFGVPVQMLAKRPDVQQAELAFRSAFELTNAAQASFYPSLTLNSGSLIGFVENFKPENIIANILASLTQPIFAQKQLIGQLRIRKAQQEESLLSFQKAVLTAGKEVSDIMYTYEASLTKNAPRAKQVESLGTAVYFTQELLKAGESDYTEVLIAEQNLLQAQLGQVSDKLEQLQATVDLYRALGGGVK
ncbi:MULTISPECIES: efflux transporter outer membrane subunit [unclassified Dysgonomonas]|uniref:efflux transporter outer membrane subunit n=1 Tax=unclassified Dysgonomonas TaxID=2630389 RepID=UPI00068103DE|nr:MULTISPECIES: efflux transporter outer membrane subunit [unclassified Dysgonomonas]MBD8348074.1 efflux transporter outer membrane subunit [Dysgonomonas sp. HGC4]MBF0575952.1 efflux transporter outer membrane subunit [Dysgonomonas sp. GY617]